MSVKPLGDRVIIKVINNKERIVGGIVLPETAKDHPNEAEVVAVGVGRYRGDKLIPIPLKEGDKVVYRKNYGTEIELDEEGTFLILDEDDILAVIE